MKLTIFGLVLAGCLVAISAETARAEDSDATVYELRTYTTHPGRLPALNKRFRDHTCKLFEKHGMTNVMYWTPVDKENTLIYILKHESPEAAKKSWAGFRSDPEWNKARTESEQDGPIVMKVESVYMKTTDYSPQVPKK